MDYNYAIESNQIYEVSELIRKAKRALEDKFDALWVRGEVSNFVQPSSGHWYFTLKDDKAQLRCVMFRSENKKLGIGLEDGLQVLSCCRISLYEARGQFQAVVEQLELAGDGALRLAFERLREKLQEEGLFDPERKALIPELPKHIGVITSEKGAVLYDILTVLKRRCPMTEVTLLSATVQGNQAPNELINMLTLAERFNANNAQGPIETLIMARGGGSLEDLQAFNDEKVARAIAQCTIPIISGVGHEPDITIADMVADLRAPTPSVAAEMASPDQKEWQAKCLRLHTGLIQRMQALLQQKRQQIQQNQARLRNPSNLLEDYQQRLDDLSTQSRIALKALLADKGRIFERLYGQLQGVGFAGLLDTLRLRLNHLKMRMDKSMGYRLQSTRQNLRIATATLDALSPLQTLNRGYAVVRQGKATTTLVSQVAVGQQIAVFLSDGQLDCSVSGKTPGARLLDSPPDEIDTPHEKDLFSDKGES